MLRMYSTNGILWGMCAALLAAPAFAKPLHYNIDAGRSSLIWQVDDNGFGAITGLCPGLSGWIDVDEAHPAASSVEISLPVARITTGFPALDEKLMSADFLFADRYRSMHFKSTSMRVKGNAAEIAGELTINGTTLPQTVKAVLTCKGVYPGGKEQLLVFHAQGVVRRGVFGVTGGMPGLSEQVRFTADIRALEDKTASP